MLKFGIQFQNLVLLKQKKIPCNYLVNGTQVKILFTDNYVVIVIIIVCYMFLASNIASLQSAASLNVFCDLKCNRK